LIIGGTIALVLILNFIRESQIPKPEEQLMERVTGNPAIEAQVVNIASKFICSCGTCGEQSLDSCTCNTAITERDSIRTLLQAGTGPEEVIRTIQDTYGWLKPAFEFTGVSPEPRGQDALPASSPSLKNDFKLLSARPGGGRHAGKSDREDIFSHFKCPCGKCGMDELKECECDHPRGAREVKAFVDGFIGRGEYTVAEIIAEIEKTYGSRKF